MKFKKVLSVFGIFSTMIGAIYAANSAIFALAKKKNSDFQLCKFYQWQYGNIHYKCVGHGKPIVLLHSLFIGANHQEFEKNITELAKSYTVYAVDLPGFGYSDKPKITYTAFIYASFIKDFITDVVGGKASVIAANGSGMFATITAKLFPNCIEKLMLISPNGISDKMAENSDFFHRTILELPLNGTTAYNILASKKNIKKFLTTEGFFAPHHVTNQIIDNFYLSAHGTNGDVRYAYASWATNYMNMDIKSYFSNLTQPIFVAWGEENENNPMHNMDILEEMRPEIEFFIFENTKLFPHMENATEFNTLVKNKI